jgi:hypothetical protein
MQNHIESKIKLTLFIKTETESSAFETKLRIRATRSATKMTEITGNIKSSCAHCDGPMRSVS